MVRTAAGLLRRQGYAATGWRQVVAESGAPWGSQAHHFPGGKEQLAAEAVRLSGTAYQRLLAGALEHDHPAEAVRAWSRVAAHQLEASEWADGCPVATVALETAHTSPVLDAACDGALTSWRDTFIDAMTRRGVRKTEARSLATLVLAAIEGALLLSRVRHDGEPLRTVGRELERLLRERVP
jgi:TetR/AcrR family transcriptional repressor of lmrAB and yxaGH operons